MFRILPAITYDTLLGIRFIHHTYLITKFALAQCQLSDYQ